MDFVEKHANDLNKGIGKCMLYLLTKSTSSSLFFLFLHIVIACSDALRAYRHRKESLDSKPLL
jgi:hypothetical protein